MLDIDRCLLYYEIAFKAVYGIMPSVGYSHGYYYIYGEPMRRKQFEDRTRQLEMSLQVQFNPTEGD